MNITVLGCGRWGAFHAWYADRIGHTVTLWGRPHLMGPPVVPQSGNPSLHGKKRIPDLALVYRPDRRFGRRPA